MPRLKTLGSTLFVLAFDTEQMNLNVKTNSAGDWVDTFFTYPTFDFDSHTGLDLIDSMGSTPYLTLSLSGESDKIGVQNL